jgi:hypothetical protein
MSDRELRTLQITKNKSDRGFEQRTFTSQSDLGFSLINQEDSDRHKIYPNRLD